MGDMQSPMGGLWKQCFFLPLGFHKKLKSSLRSLQRSISEADFGLNKLVVITNLFFNISHMKLKLIGSSYPK